MWREPVFGQRSLAGHLPLYCGEDGEAELCAAGTGITERMSALVKRL